MTNAITRLIREPLTQFVVCGVVLFLLYDWLNPNAATDSKARHIVVSSAQIELLAARFERTWGKPPQPEELKKLVEAQIQEEVYYREALAVGLDRNDPIVRRRMQQKLRFLHEDISALDEPTNDDLLQFYENRKADYAVAAKISISQVFIKPVRDASERALQVLDQLRNGGAATQLGDASLLPKTISAATNDRIAGTFGDDFTAALESLEAGIWAGPIRSSFGLHLVWIDKRTTSKEPEFAEVQKRLRRDLIESRRSNARDRIYAELRNQYSIAIEWPQEQSGKTLAEAL